MIPHSSPYGRPPAEFGRGLVAASAAATGLAAYSGIVFASGGQSAAVVLPVAAVLAAALAALAIARFGLFVIVVLAIRSSLDMTKLAAGPNSGGQTGWSVLDPSTLLGMLLLVVGLAWLSVQGRRPAAERPHPALPVAAVGFVLAAALSLLGSVAPLISVGEVARVAAFVVMIFVVERLVAADPGLRGPLLCAVFGSAVLPVLATAYQVVTGNGLLDLDGLMRPVGTFWHPNALGMFCFMIMIMGVALLWHVSGRNRVMLALVVAGLGFALVATGSRGPWLAALAGLVVVGALQDRRVLLGIPIVVAGVLLAVPSVLSRFGELTTGYTDGGREANSLVWRLGHWIDGIGLLSGNPVTGVGLGTTRQLLFKEMHNDYLRALVESGVVGLLAYLGLLAALLVTARRALAATDPRRGAPRVDVSRGIAVGFAGCVVAFGVSALADNIMTAVVVMWYLAAFAGLAQRIAHPGEERH
jgi:O-antigen ligase